MKKTINSISKELKERVREQWLCRTKKELEDADGREVKNNLICRKGSILYAAYSDDNICLYVGETSKSIKRRFISDGAGSHKIACQNWYREMTYVKFLIFENSELPEKHRKFFEQALAIALKPKFYGRKTGHRKKMKVIIAKGF